MKPINQMETEELLLETLRLRASISEAATRLGEVYGQLYSKVRREPLADNTTALITVAGAGRRFATLVLGGLRRQSPFDRLAGIKSVDPDKQRRIAAEERQILAEEKERQEQATKRKEEREAKKTTAARPTSMIADLYGEGFE